MDDITGVQGESVVIPSGSDHSELEMEIEDAMESGKKIILIKDSRVGRDVSFWLHLGRHVLDMSVVAAVGSVLLSAQRDDGLRMLGKPLAMGGLVLNAAYCLGWLTHPFSRYRVAYGPCMPMLQCLKFHEEDEEVNVLLVRQHRMIYPWFTCLVALASFTVSFQDVLSPTAISNYFYKLKEGATEFMDGVMHEEEEKSK